MPPNSSPHAYVSTRLVAKGSVTSSPASTDSDSNNSSSYCSRFPNKVKMPVSLNKNTLIQTEKCCFLIMDAPTNSNVANYVEQMKKCNVTALVRACKPSYDKTPVEKAGIRVEDMCFADGTSPPDEILRRWLELTEELFTAPKPQKAHKKRHSVDGSGDMKAAGSESGDEQPRPCVAVHCVAGLGRAPVLVALALMEIERMDALTAIEKIRAKRRGAFNAKQIGFLEQYKRRRRRRSARGSQCAIM